MQMQDMMRLFQEMMSSDNKDSEDNNDNNDNNEESPEQVNNDSFDFGNINFDILSKMGDLFSHMNRPDMNGELLVALRPHLREENRHKIDTAVKLSKMISLFPFLKDSGILNDLF